MKSTGIVTSLRYSLCLISGDSIADVKFNPDELFFGSEDQGFELEVS